MKRMLFVLFFAVAAQAAPQSAGELLCQAGIESGSLHTS